MSEAVKSKHKAHEPVLLLLMVLAAIAVIAMHVSPLWEFSFLIHFGPLMAVLALVAALNASLMVGYRNAGVFLLLGATIGFAAEQIGILTGNPFGPYYYTDKLGAKIGDVPWVIPLCWFGLVYFAHVITNLVMHAHPVPRSRNVAHAALLALITALVATGFDVAMDPAMSHESIGAWVWTDGGDYMGVPFKNFRGWIMVSFAIDFLYRLFVGFKGTQPISQRAQVASMVLLIVWFSLGLGYILIGFPLETQLISIFCIILPALMALATLYGRGWNAAR